MENVKQVNDVVIINAYPLINLGAPVRRQDQHLFLREAVRLAVIEKRYKFVTCKIKLSGRCHQV